MGKYRYGGVVATYSVEMYENGRTLSGRLSVVIIPMMQQLRFHPKVRISSRTG